MDRHTATPLLPYPGENSGGEAGYKESQPQPAAGLGLPTSVKVHQKKGGGMPGIPPLRAKVGEKDTSDNTV